MHSLARLRGRKVLRRRGGHDVHRARVSATKMRLMLRRQRLDTRRVTITCSIEGVDLTTMLNTSLRTKVGYMLKHCVLYVPFVSGLSCDQMYCLPLLTGIITYYNRNLL